MREDEEVKIVKKTAKELDGAGGYAGQERRAGWNIMWADDAGSAGYQVRVDQKAVGEWNAEILCGNPFKAVCSFDIIAKETE